MHQVIDARAADPAMHAVPGGKTGLVVKTVKGVGKGEDFRLVEEYRVDTDTLRSILEHERRAAKEVGILGRLASGAGPQAIDPSTWARCAWRP